MPDWARTALKWTGALVAMALVVVYALPRAFEAISSAVTIGDEEVVAEPADPPPADDEPESTSETAVGTGSARVSRGSVANVGLGTSGLTADDQHVLLAFPRPPTDPACVTDAELVVRVDAVEGDPEVALHATRLGTLEGLEPGDPLPADAIVDAADDPTAPVTAATETLRWPADGVYGLAAGQGADEGGLVLALRFAAGAAGEVMFVTSPGDDDRSPRLSWTALVDCPG